MRQVGWIVCVVVAAACATGFATAAEMADSEAKERVEPGLNAETFAGLELRNIGPALMSGRIADIAIHPEDASVWYVAVGSGNLWKTVNSGTTWETIFADQPSYSIGDVTIDPNHPDVIWVGTGENVGGRHVGYGDGVYKSLDGGKTWKNMGLEKSEHIGRILVDPRDSDVVWVAAQGPLWSKGGERGLFKTTDGGETWTNVLSAGPYTGVNEMVMDPRDPDVLYAATHQRSRTVAALIDGGPDTGIHKTTDGGETWTELTTGLPEEEMGRIGLAISPQDPDVVYATIELAWREGGFYRSEDGGASWEKRSDYLSGGTGPHYYQEIYASPHAFDRIYQMDVRLHWSVDGGTTFTMVGEQDKHGDNHAIAFNPADPDYLLVGSDGGLYESWDLGKTWKFISNLPVTQFYKVAIDYDEPFYNVYGGTQDNNSQGGPSRTDNVHGIRSSDWFITLGGDGHQSAVDYSNPDIVYAESQQGYMNRYDRRTGETVFIQPQPEAGAPAERFNWDSPILISPHDPARLYFASQRVWRSDDRGDSWTAISGDLSRGQDRLTMPMMERVQSIDAIWDLRAMSNYANVTSLSESPVEEGLLYAGTDDGLIQVSGDGGGSWRRIESFADVPAESFVNDVKADLFDADTVYAAFDNHKRGDFAPYVVKSTDRGRTWRSIAGDLPDRHLVWRVVQDHEKTDLLFAGTEFGVFFTVDGGSKWVKLAGGAPNIPFRDLVIHTRENDLVGATFGRGFYVFDDYTPLREVSEEALQEEAILFPVRDAWWYVERRPLGRSQRATQGGDFYVAPNPPFGAVFTYYLRDGFETLKEARREAEKELAEEGEDTPYPGWDAMREEALEEEPAIVFTVRNAAGEVVRRMTAPAGAGFTRVAWDLRYPPTDAIVSLEEEEPEGGQTRKGPLVEPGTFTVEMAKRVRGELTPLGEAHAFEVKRMTEGTLPGSTEAEMVAFNREIAEVKREVDAVVELLDRTAGELELIRHALDDSTDGDGELDREVRRLERELADMRLMVHGDELQSRLGEPIPHSIRRRLRAAETGTGRSTYGPTGNLRGTLDIAIEELAGVKASLAELLEIDLATLAERLEQAGVPWTPGRPVPD